MNLSFQQDLFLQDVVKLLQFAWGRGFKVTGGELYRTAHQQGLYFADGKTTTMNSKHRQRLAIDLNFFIEDVLKEDKETLQELGSFWEALSDRNRWGGSWSTFLDTTHFERMPG